MKDKISFSDLKAKYEKNATELEEIDRLNIDYKSIIDNKRKTVENYDKMISSINPDNQKDFEIQSKDYMEKITALEEEIRQDEEKAGRKEKLVKENKKIVEDARERKDSLERQVLEDYEKNKKDDQKNMSEDVKKAKSELENFKSQLVKMEEDEINFPHKVKDTKYKEFLKNKIAEKDKFIKENDKSSAEEIRDFLLNEIREEYLAFKKGISKEYMPEEAKNPNPVLEAAKKKREENGTPVGGPAGKKGLPPLKSGTKVIVGRKGQISYDGEKYKISSKTIKKALNMTPTEVISVMKDNGLKMSKELEDAIRLGIKSNTLDSTVLAGICAARKMPEDTKKLLLTHYLEDGIKASNKKDAKNSLNLTYDQKDLSKSSILKRIFRREVNSDEKYEMMKKARVGERYGIAKTEGEYEPDKKSRLISFLSRNKIQKLPTMKETIEVAELYNEMRDNAAKKDDKDFKESLKAKTKGFSEAQLTELKELKESQEKQEEPEK